ncbi:MAG: hypothetical protein RMM98_05305 [Acidobacteriota bacterium]|nr:hypothetical protein [Blastocatellia bacterium]MDW8239012.1 hypothetical protein [Acidobacteriota bacterium]
MSESKKELTAWQKSVQLVGVVEATMSDFLPQTGEDSRIDDADK